MFEVIFYYYYLICNFFKEPNPLNSLLRFLGIISVILFFFHIGWWSIIKNFILFIYQFQICDFFLFENLLHRETHSFSIIRPPHLPHDFSTIKKFESWADLLNQKTNPSYDSVPHFFSHIFFLTFCQKDLCSKSNSRYHVLLYVLYGTWYLLHPVPVLYLAPIPVLDVLFVIQCQCIANCMYLAFQYPGNSWFFSHVFFLNARVNRSTWW